jgi:hypothetical protein
MVQDSVKNALQMKPTRGSFSLETIRNLPQFVPEIKESKYIFDAARGRKRRHDPWFKQHRKPASEKEPIQVKKSEPPRKQKSTYKKTKLDLRPPRSTENTKGMPEMNWVDSVFA